MNLQEQVKQLGRWYHSIRLSEEVVTPGEPYEPSWNNTRTVRGRIDYSGKFVLDVATFDGMWAFEAEQLGAARVVGVDCMWRENPLFCKQVLGSKVVFLLNVPPHELTRRLDSYLHCRDFWRQDCPEKFDIVQHLGLFYHLRDPMQSVLECRNVIKDGGKLLFESAVMVGETRKVMQFNPCPYWSVYDDATTWWAPSVNCLKEIMDRSLFEVDTGSISVIEQDHGIGRVSLIATAKPVSECNPANLAELRNTYRTPGLSL